MENAAGKAQREAVNVIFRLLEALGNRDTLFANKLLCRLRKQDHAKVYFDFEELVDSILEEGITDQSLSRIHSYFDGTPFASFFLEITDRT